MSELLALWRRMHGHHAVPPTGVELVAYAQAAIGRLSDGLDRWNGLPLSGQAMQPTQGVYLDARREEWRHALAVHLHELLQVWNRERWGDVPPADLVAYGRRRVAELDRVIQATQPPTLAGYAMEIEPGYSVADNLHGLTQLRDAWATAIEAVELTSDVRHSCWACDATLAAGEVCVRCCGAEAMPGRCALPAGHEGEHLAPLAVLPPGRAR